MIYTNIFIAVLVIFSLVYLRKKLRRNALLSRFRADWGAFPENYISAEMIDNYEKRTYGLIAPENYRLDDATWHDLDLESLFSLINRTMTPVGAQYLYRLLYHPALNRQQLEKRDILISKLHADQVLREKIQLCLHHLNDRRAENLPQALWGIRPLKPKYAFIFYILSAVAMICLLLAIAGKMSYLLLLLPFSINLFTYYFEKRKVQMDLYGFQFLGVLISVAEKIGELDAPELIELTNRLKSSLKKVRGISSKIFTMQFRDELGLLEYLNIYFMWDIAGFYSVLDKIENNIAALREIFQIVGHLDAMIAIASFRQAYPQNCRPQFPSNPDKFFVQDMLHPLLDAPVANSFDFAGRQFLISGANMAGKTTFLKAVGLNSVLAQTIYTCIATKFEAPLLRVISSVERQDNLLHGKSYYLAEVESVLRITRAADSQEQYLFLLDEIFRGTNSVERQAISYAVLRYLVNRKDFLLVATHDLNLCERLQDQYANFHFCEEVNSRGLAFDYKIQPGIARTRNAIALLRYVGYPDSIIEIAQKCVEKISAPEPGTHPIDGKNQQ